MERNVGRRPSGSEQELMGVILAAGTGSRIAPFSERWPKPMLPVLGKPLIEYQIESLRAAGVQRVLVVVDHHGELIRESLQDGSRLGVKIDYVEQKSTLGSAHALTQVEKHVDVPFLLLLGDIFFIHDDLRSMAARLGFHSSRTGGSRRSRRVQGVLAVKEERSLEAIRRNYVAIEDERGFVRRVVEKPRHPSTQLKGCGIYLFEPSFFDAVRRTPRSAMRDEYELTDAIQIFIDDGARIRTSRVIQDDLNLTFPVDLLELNLKLLDRHIEGLQAEKESRRGRQLRSLPELSLDPERFQSGSFLGKGVEIEKGAQVQRSVLMDGVKLREGAIVRDSLVFPGVQVEAGVSLERAIHLGDQILKCP